MIGNLNKKIFVLFLSFLPLIGFGQDFDFHDIQKIDSREGFKKFALENLFSNLKRLGSSKDLQYNYHFNGDPYSQMGIFWYNNEEEFSFQFNLNDKESNFLFETIINQIKSDCKYYTIDSDSFPEKIYYTCHNSKYKGKTTFYKVGNLGYVSTSTNLLL